MQITRKKVLKFIREHGLLAPGNKVVVAFSGGADSMALLDILTSLPEFPLQISIAHLNHCLRGDESDGDELFVRRVAEKYALPFEISRVDIKAVADAHGLSLEEAGRDARRLFLLETAQQQSADAVAFGHHRDDQAETVLMRLIRGAAGSGLAGMQPRATGSIFVRPLLCLTRADTEGYLRKASLQWREDSSNADTSFLRNRVRHELLPLLSSYNEKMMENLNRIAQALAADEALLDEVVEQAFLRLASTCPGQIRIQLQLLRHESPALRKRLYRKALLRLRGDLRQISAQHLADIDRLASGARGSGKISLPTGMLVSRDYEALTLTTIPAEPVRGDWELSIDSCGCYQLGNEQAVLVERVASLPASWQEVGADTLFLEVQQFPFPWIVRSFRAGDRCTPFGMGGRKKIKDLFIDKKIRRAARKMIPLFLCGGEIFWAGGVQKAERTRVTEAGGELLRLRIIGAASAERH